MSSFYVEKSIEKQKSTFKILKIKTDSLRNILEKRENQLASMEDSWMGRYSNTSKIDQKRLKDYLLEQRRQKHEQMKKDNCSIQEINDFDLKTSFDSFDLVVLTLFEPKTFSLNFS